MSVYVIEHPLDPLVTDITARDIEKQGRTDTVKIVEFAEDPREQLESLSRQPIKDGDIVCFGGTALRTKVWDLSDLATGMRKNLMPGRANDHRGVQIPDGKFLHRKAQEQNGYPGIPYVMVLGDAKSARQSWKTVFDLDDGLLWKDYRPETLTSMHWLSAAALDPSWLVVDWFRVVDLSRQDLEVTPTTYATQQWHDWLAFFPANGRFKIENHAQLDPVWLDSSTKVMEHWGYVRRD